MTPDTLVGLLAEPERLRVVAALVLGARTPSELIDATGLDQCAVGRALQRLETGGLITSAADGCPRSAPVDARSSNMSCRRSRRAPLHREGGRRGPVHLVRRGHRRPRQPAPVPRRRGPVHPQGGAVLALRGLGGRAGRLASSRPLREVQAPGRSSSRRRRCSVVARRFRSHSCSA